MKTYFIKTFGCQMNVSDSERIAAVLKKYGFNEASNINEANLAVFNTCGVRQMAEDRVYGQIHNLKTNPPTGEQKLKTKIILTGCLANRKDVQRRLKDKVDLFCEIKNFSEEIEKFLQTKNYPLRRSFSEASKLKTSFNSAPSQYMNIMPAYSTEFSAYIPIMTGCNNFCSYCVVPYARGRETSRPVEEIVNEIKSLVKKGCKSITLLGQNVNSYNSQMNANSKRMGANVNFSRLLKKINAIPGNFWIQFVSNHPKDVTDEMIETVAKCKKVGECFHLPLQAGDDTVLKNMNRGYTAAEYLKIIKKIKSAFKKYKLDLPYAITTDIIVGFPGETRKQFLKSAEVMKEVSYDMAYFGQYSPRPETAAWNMKNNVSKREKSRREKYLNEILKTTAFENNKKYVGRMVDVLIEKEDKEVYFGKTRTMKNVKVISNKKELIGKFTKLKITAANSWNLEGKLL